MPKKFYVSAVVVTVISELPHIGLRVIAHGDAPQRAALHATVGGSVEIDEATARGYCALLEIPASEIDVDAAGPCAIVGGDMTAGAWLRTLADAPQHSEIRPVWGDEPPADGDPAVSVFGVDVKDGVPRVLVGLDRGDEDEEDEVADDETEAVRIMIDGHPAECCPGCDADWTAGGGLEVRAGGIATRANLDRDGSVVWSDVEGGEVPAFSEDTDLAIYCRGCGKLVLDLPGVTEE